MTVTATYRVQFHAGFTFADAVPLAPYWRALGVSHLYASPIAVARKGSTHGYDVVDPEQVNPELGGEAGLQALVAALKAEGLGLILDIVPNHMAVGGDDNAWWLDVLENGPGSRYARWFDIDWDTPDPRLRGKLLAPFLGSAYGEALRSGDLRVVRDGGKLSVMAYGAHRFPLRPESLPLVLEAAGAAALDDLSAERLDAVFDGRTAEGAARLHALLETQHYRLAWWRSAGDAINWRRFFDITELAGLRVEDEAVFDAVHALPLRLYAEGLIDGVRVDHVDGLADPGGYCRRLRAALDAAAAARPADAATGPAYLVVEKILGPDEAMADWPVDGTTGYDFMNEVSAVLHAPQGAAPLADLWSRISGRSARFEVEEHAARAEIAVGHFAGQVAAAARAFADLAAESPDTRDLSTEGLRRAILALVGAFPAYRTYAVGDAAPASDAALLQVAVETAAHGPDAAIVRRLGLWLAGEGPGSTAARQEAQRRFQQLSAPVAAKAVEDTAFYRYGRLLSRTDVGFAPGRLSLSPADFLAKAQARAERFPRAMLATATHDHKRGEDVRARLAVLSEIPETWSERAGAWLDAMPPGAVDPGDAHILHQMIVGAWPLDLSPDDAQGLAAFADRLAGWQRKALREAKLRSSWAEPNEVYEAACEALLRATLAGDGLAGQIHAFVEEIAPAGAAKSLVQAGLRLTLPGVPDLYQGTEFWDFSLVDPDNRRPVDYAARRSSIGVEPASWRDGARKQALIAELLDLRRQAPAVFAAPLEIGQAQGSNAGSIMVFRRRTEGRTLSVVAATTCASACLQTRTPDPPADWWRGQAVRWPDGVVEDLGALAGAQAFAARLDSPPPR